MPDAVIAHGVYPTEAVWQIPLGGKAFVDYLPGADVGGWEDAYELARKESQVMAAVIAAHLKAGGAPNTHGVALDFDGAIVR